MTGLVLPASRPDVRFAELLPVALGMLRAAADGGKDARREVLPLLALSAAAEGKLESMSVQLAAEIQRFLNPSREDRIDALYRELAALAKAPEARVEYEARLTQLKTLQHEEAQEFGRRHRAARALDPSALRDSISRAQEILNRHADPSGQNKPT